MEQTMQAMVTKEMTMGDIIQKWPAAAEIMQSFGLHCFGCHVNLFESLEQGVMGHGMTEETMNDLLNDLNKMAGGGEMVAPQQEEVHEHKEPEIILTDIAAQKLKELLEKQNKYPEYGIRVQVVRGGCAGYMYNMDFERAQQANDTMVEEGDVKLFIDNDSFELLRGITLDYVETLQGAGFKFDNPNAKASCGCGKSFH